MSSVAPSPLSHALPDLAAWTRHVIAAELPVMRDTADALEGMRQHQDSVDANLLGEMIAPDPLMTLKVMAHAASKRPPTRVSDPETVTGAIVMMGISPFFEAFGPQPIVEEWLAERPDALAGMNQVLRRGRRASQFALAFAVHRMDSHTAVVHQAALLHDFAELLLWVHAPALALGIQTAQSRDTALRSADAQRALLHIELADLQQALMRHWRLPDLLVRISDDRHASHPSVKTVLLAIRVARHSALGWDNPALPDDIRDIGDLLQLSPKATSALLHDIDH